MLAQVRMATVALAALGAVDLDLLGAEAQLDGLAVLGADNRVAAPLEADQPVAGDLSLGPREDQVGDRRQRPQGGVVALGASGNDLTVGAVDAATGDV